MDAVYRKVVDEIFKTLIHPANVRFTLDQVAEAASHHLELYFIPRINELLRKDEHDASDLRRIKSRISGKWKIEYDNDTGPEDECFTEWWNVTDGTRYFQCSSENGAIWLCNTLQSSEDD